MATVKGAIVVDTERCKGCGLCVGACPVKILGLSLKEVNKRGYPFSMQLEDKCIGCAACAIGCPDGCISVYKTKI